MGLAGKPKHRSFTHAKRVALKYLSPGVAYNRSLAGVPTHHKQKSYLVSDLPQADPAVPIGGRAHLSKLLSEPKSTGEKNSEVAVRSPEELPVRFVPETMANPWKGSWVGAVEGRKKKETAGSRPSSRRCRIIARDSSKRCRPTKDRHACQEALRYLSAERPISSDPLDSLGGFRIVSS
ncbi:hypothetical protein KM043_009664 [Ampulex compressa]|nr:hypothetical protein KM043_009664 [Ampulex compressa]